MDNITIGIPRGLLYYKNKYLWTEFFKELGVNILISPEILPNQINIENKSCLFLKTYFGHVEYLLDKVDYIFIPRCSKKGLCNYFSSLYDIVNNKYDVKILTCNIGDNEEEMFLNIGKRLGYTRHVTLDAYNMAKKEEYKQKKINYLLMLKKLKRDNKKVLLIGKDYIINDNYIKNNILNVLKNNNIELIDSNNVNPDDYIDEKTYKKALFNNIESLEKYVDKTLILSTTSCVSNFMLIYDNYKKNLDKKVLINIKEEKYFNNDPLDLDRIFKMESNYE